MSQREQQRIQFLIDRDGMKGALAFAKQTRSIYRQSVLGNGVTRPFHYASTRAYKRAFIESYLYLKRFIANAEG